MKNITVTCKSCTATKKLANCTVKEASGMIVVCLDCKTENILVRVNDLEVEGVELSTYNLERERLRERLIQR